MYNSVLILLAQAYSLFGVQKLSVRPFGMEEILEPKVVTNFWMMSGLAHDYQRMIFVDSICVFLCVANMFMHFRRLWFFVNMWLNSL